MRNLTHLAVAAILAVPVALTAQAPMENAPACSAELDGETLTTTIEFNDGYAVIAPWDVMGSRATTTNGAPGHVIAVHLDHIVEHDPITGQAKTTPFPSPVETTFEGGDMDEVVYQAAQVWCMTVMRVRADGQGALVPPKSERKLPVRTTMWVRPSATLFG